MTTKIITVEATPPAESTGADYYKGAPLNAAEFDQNLVNLRAAVDRKASLSNPTFTGTVTLPSTTSIGDVSATELQYLNSVTSNVQDQINAKAPIDNPTFTGTVSLSTGTANGVLYLNGSKQVTSGSGLVFDSSGNLGIGTSSPGAKLEVNGGNANTEVRINNSANTVGRTITLRMSSTQNPSYTGAGAYMQAIQGAGVDVYSLAFGTTQGSTSATERMRIESSGNVGIGTASPAAKLVVSNSGSEGIEFGYSAGLTSSFIQSINRVGGAGVDLSYYLTGTAVHRFYTDGSERMRLDTSGNLGLGVTPSAWVSTYKAMQLGGYTNIANTGGGYSFYSNNGYVSETGWKYVTNNKATLYQSGIDGQHAWFNAPSGTAGNAITWTQAMTLDSSGNLLVGQTAQSSTEKLGIAFAAGNSGIYTKVASTATQYHLSFSNGAVVGAISTNGSTTTYSTSSDYRLKEDYQPVADAITRLNQLKPINFAWKINGERCDGFLAHELQEVIPEAATGAKDEVDEEGNPKYQGIDQSKIVPLLTAALQEAVAKIESLTQRIEALENKGE